MTLLEKVEQALLLRKEKGEQLRKQKTAIFEGVDQILKKTELGDHYTIQQHVTKTYITGGTGIVIDLGESHQVITSIDIYSLADIDNIGKTANPRKWYPIDKALSAGLTDWIIERICSLLIANLYDTPTGVI